MLGVHEPVRSTPQDGTPLSITAPSLSQGVLAANPNRSYLLFQNLSADTLWVNFGATATQDAPSIKLLSGGHLEYEQGYVPNSTVTVIGPNAGAKFTCKEG